MKAARKDLEVRAIAVKDALERYQADGHACAGTYRIADLLVTAGDCIREATARFYFDFAGNRTRELTYAIESLELCIKRLEGERAAFEAAFFGSPIVPGPRGVRPPKDPSPFCFYLPPEHIRVPGYWPSGRAA